MNRLGFNQEPPLPEGMMGTSVYNALKDIPGRERFLKKSLRALAEYLNALQDDMQNMIGMGTPDTSNMDADKAGIIQRAFDEISQGLPSLRNAIDRLVQRITQGGLDNILNLPMLITSELLGSLGSVLHGIFSMLTNGVGYRSLVPTSVPKLWNLITAVFSDAMSSPSAMSRLALKMMAPPSVARWL